MSWDSWSKFSEYCLKHGEWILVVSLLVIALLFLAYQQCGIVLRRRSFLARECLNEEALFQRFWPSPEGDRAIMKSVLEAFATEIGVHWTQFRPGDTFEGNLKVHRRFAWHDDLEDVENEISALAQRFRILLDPPPPFQGSLQQFVNHLLKLPRNAEGG